MLKTVEAYLYPSQLHLSGPSTRPTVAGNWLVLLGTTIPGSLYKTGTLLVTRGGGTEYIRVPWRWR
jgi:hypothetical protein